MNSRSTSTREFRQGPGRLPRGFSSSSCHIFHLLSKLPSPLTPASGRPGAGGPRGPKEGSILMAARKDPPPPPARPLIAINTDHLAPKNGTPYTRLNAGYIDAILAAGGLPLLLP